MIPPFLARPGSGGSGRGSISTAGVVPTGGRMPADAIPKQEPPRPGGPLGSGSLGGALASRERLLTVAGVAAWISMCLSLAVEVRAAGRVSAGQLACGASLLGFAATYVGGALLPLPARARLVTLGGAAAFACWASYYPFGAFTALLCVTTAQAAFYLGPREAAAWTAASVAASSAVLGARPDLDGAHAANAAVLYGTFQVFAAIAGSIIVRAASDGDALSDASAQLLGAHTRLAEQERALERVRIARDLHDSAGHQLTALAVKLELLRASSEGAPRAAAEELLGLARAALDAVRASVRGLRSEARLSLPEALHVLARAVERPRVHLRLPEPFPDLPEHVGDALFRIAQELVTNGIRHARAQNLWLSLDRGPEGLRLEARDDGVGLAVLAPSTGLAGMQERVAELGGSLELEGRLGRGVRVTVDLPLGAGSGAGVVGAAS
ncbi:MAG: sensor histidine kinase [Myxococcales bacterium]